MSKNIGKYVIIYKKIRYEGIEMKKTKQRIISILLSVAMILGLVLVTPATVKANGMDPVTGVKLNGNILSWDPFPGAASYSISYGNNRGTFGVTGATSVDLRKAYYEHAEELPAGTYYSSGIVARDSKGNKISSPGAVPDFYYDAYGMTQLDTPQNLRVETTSSGRHQFVCDPVLHATTYLFEVKEGPYSTALISEESSTNKVEIPADKEYLFAEGSTYTLRIKVKANGYITNGKASSTISGWYDALPEINAHIEGDFFYWNPLAGAAKYDYSMSTFGGYIFDSPVDLRAELNQFNKPAGTYTFKFYALDEKGVRISKYWTADYVYDGKPSNKYAVTFETEYGTAPAVQIVNKGSTASKPSDPVDNDHKFMYWYKKKASSNPFDFSTSITEPTVLIAKWYDKIKSVSITPGKTPQEGLTVSQIKGTIPADAKYKISEQTFLSGNTGKTMKDNEKLEGGCDYIWTIKYYIPVSSHAAWDDLNNITIPTPSGMSVLKDPIIDENGYLIAKYYFRTEGYSSLEIVEAANITIRTTVANLSSTTGVIKVTNSGDRPATVSPSIYAIQQKYITLDSFNDFSIQPGESKNVTVKLKDTLSPGQYGFEVWFTTGSSVQRASHVTVIVEGEATKEMSLTINDPDDNPTSGSITVPEGYPETQASGWKLWLKSDDDIDSVDVKLLPENNEFNIGQVVSGWSEKPLPFDYNEDEDLVIAIYPNKGMSEGTYHVTAVISGYEMKTITTDLTFVVSHVHNMNKQLRVEPTCTSEGLKEFWYCTKCNKNYKDSEGKVELTSLAELAIPASSHFYGDWKVDSEPTHASPGERHHNCTVCGAIEYDYPPAIPCVVEFENNGHGTKPDSEEVAYGNACPYMGALSEYGWDFLGWYIEPWFENEYDFSSPVLDDITVYAKWQEHIEYINTVDIGNIWTMLDPLNTVPFTTEVHDELDTDGVNFNDKMEIVDECWSAGGVPSITASSPGIPVLNKIYSYSVTLKAKGFYKFDEFALGLPFNLIVGGTIVDSMTHMVSAAVKNEGKTVTIMFASIPVAPVEISAVDISGAVVSGITDKTYTGSAQTQDMTLKIDVNGTTFDLEPGTDYDVSYSNNTEVGTATVTITGKGNFTGSIGKTFEITKAEGPGPEATPTPGTEPTPGIDPTPEPTPGTEDTSIEAVEKTIMEEDTENDIKGSTFLDLMPKSTKQTKSSITITWKKMADAKKYIVYASKCGKTAKMVKVAETNKTKYVLKKLNKKKLKKGTYYKVIIVAVDKDNKVISKTVTVHAATSGGKVGNYKSITTKAKKNKVSIKAGKSFKLKGKAVAKSKKQKVKKHVAVRYESTDPNVATVSSKGVIKGVGKGKCYVYAYGQNGVYKKIKVTIK